MIKLQAPTQALHGQIVLPISKSLANRTLVLQFLQKQALLPATTDEPDDVRVLREAFILVGNKTHARIDVGAAGTAMRFLTACLAMLPGEWILQGSVRMEDRPIAALVTALRELGADIQFIGKEGFPPLLIKGKKLHGKHLQMPANYSSQFISAILMIAPFLEEGLQIDLLEQAVSEPYIGMTLELLSTAGATVSKHHQHIDVKSGLPTPSSSTIQIEADWSAASYYYALVALRKGSQIRLTGLSPSRIQGDSIVSEIFSELGVRSTFDDQGVLIEHKGTVLRNFDYNCINCPDLAQTIAVTCLGLGISAQLRGLQTLKIKETDRILALKTELEKFSAEITISNDALQLKPNPASHQGTLFIETYHDHRMAMSFAALSVLGYTLEMPDASVVSKSNPAFWNHLISLGFNVNLQP
jgi:3-phosphoshikimate 1-carboxyvinyltransferase